MLASLIPSSALGRSYNTNPAHAHHAFVSTSRVNQSSPFMRAGKVCGLACRLRDKRLTAYEFSYLFSSSKCMGMSLQVLCNISPKVKHSRTLALPLQMHDHQTCAGRKDEYPELQNMLLAKITAEQLSSGIFFGM